MFSKSVNKPGKKQQYHKKGSKESIIPLSNYLDASESEDQDDEAGYLMGLHYYKTTSIISVQDYWH